MIRSPAVLLNNVSADENGPGVDWQGGIAALILLGTLGGGNVTLQFLGPDQATWLNVSTATSDVTTTGIIAPVYCPAGTVRAVLAGASGETGIYCSLAPVLN